MPQLHYANPMFAAGLSNLAEALFPSDKERVQMGLLGDRRKLAQAQREKYVAEAMQTEIANREREQSLSDLESAVGQLVGGLGLEADDPRAAAARSAYGTVLRPGIAGGDKSSELASAIERLTGMMLAQGGEDQRRSARILHGGALDEDFAGTTERADAVAQRNQRGVMDVENLRRRTDLEKERISQSHQDARHRQSLDNALTSTIAKVIYESILGTGRGKDEPPIKVGGAERNAIAEAIQSLLAGADSPWYADDNELRIDPQLDLQIQKRAAELFQQSRNLPLAIEQAWTELVGTAPNWERKWDGVPYFDDPAVLRAGSNASAAGNAPAGNGRRPPGAFIR